MMWFFAILIVLALGGIAVLAAGRGTPMAEVYDDRPDVRVPGGPARWPATTCAGSASRWPCAATGCPRSTRCSTGSRASWSRGRSTTRSAEGEPPPTPEGRGGEPTD